MKRYLRHPVVQNALALYSVQFAEYVIPLITVPYLARILQPAAWGLVVYAQNFSSWLILVLEYGFGFSATREIARLRDDPDQHADVVRGVVGANVLLLIPAVVIGLVARFTVPAFRDHNWYLWLALAIAVTQGVRPFWYFQGIERMKFPAWLNVCGRAASAVGIFLLIKSPAHGWRVLALQAGVGAIVTAVIAAKMYQAVSFRLPEVKQSIVAFKAGWTIFLSRSAVYMYTMVNTFILGLFVSSAGVAYYGGAERVVLMVVGLMTPFTQAVYPRMIHLAANDREKAADAIRKGLIFFAIMGVVTAGVLIAAAPLVIRLLLGPSYRPAIAVLRVASLVIPSVAVSNILGLQWMLPFGMDRAFNRIVVSAGIINVVLAVILSRTFGPIGTASSVVVAQAFVTGSMYVMLLRSRRSDPGQTPEVAAAV
ncbi:MAG TPA: oligosaccharide flippase family protein [Bryobacteraceae bacterium]